MGTYYKKCPHPLSQIEWIWTIRDSDGLSFNEKALLTYFASRWSEGGQIFPSMARIAKDLNCSHDKIRKTAQSAEAKGWLRIKHRMSSAGDPDSNSYELRMPDGLEVQYECATDIDEMIYRGVLAKQGYPLAESEYPLAESGEGTRILQVGYSQNHDTKRITEEDKEKTIKARGTSPLAESMSEAVSLPLASASVASHETETVPEPEGTKYWKQTYEGSSDYGKYRYAGRSKIPAGRGWKEVWLKDDEIEKLTDDGKMLER